MKGDLALILHEEGTQSMRQLSFGLSSLLALGGVGMGAMGIAMEQFKIASIGIILIFAAGVFATLYLGSRQRQL